MSTYCTSELWYFAFRMCSVSLRVSVIHMRRECTGVSFAVVDILACCGILMYMYVYVFFLNVFLFYFYELIYRDKLNA